MKTNQVIIIESEETKSKGFNWKQYTPFIGILLLVLILFNIDIYRLVSIFKSANIWLFILATLISLSVLFVMTLRWVYIIRAMNIRIKYTNALEMVAKAATFASFTPAKLGEFYRIKYLMDTTYKSLGMCTSTTIIDRLFDVVCLLLLGVFCSMVLMYIFVLKVIPLWLFTIIIIVTIAGVAVMFNKNIMSFFVHPLIKVLPGKWQKFIMYHFDEFYNGLHTLGWLLFIKGLGLTLLIWFLNFTGVFLLAKALGIEVPFYFIILVYPMITLLNLIPISISGFGTNQVTTIFFLGLYNVSPESAVALSFMIIISMNWLYAVPGALLLLKPQSLNTG